MVLVDTSVWVRGLSGKEPYRTELDRLFASDQVLGHELVHAELFVGDNGGRRAMLEDYLLIEQAERVPHSEVLTFVRERRFHGRGAGWVDLELLAAAIVAGAKLWTTDGALATLAHELGVAFEMAKSHR